MVQPGALQHIEIGKTTGGQRPGDKRKVRGLLEAKRRKGFQRAGDTGGGPAARLVVGGETGRLGLQQASLRELCQRRVGTRVGTRVGMMGA